MNEIAKPLFPQPIPIIGGTGPKWSGKTLFGVQICPGPRTLNYDFEQSSVSYTWAGFDRVDVQKEMHSRFPNGYKPVDLWLWWIDHIRKIPAGKYDVIMVDPVTDLERGLTDWVFSNPGFFGHTAAQYQKMSGIGWGDVKDYYKMILADITARCQTFYFTAHVGQEFKGNTATGNLKVRGKETLYELSSLFLWFDRDPNPRGERPEIPRAKVLKSRLTVGGFENGKLLPLRSVLPNRLPVATPDAIREYFASPAGGRALRDDEVAPEVGMSEDERLRLQVQKAEAEAVVAQSRLAAMTGGNAAGRPSTPTPADSQDSTTAEANSTPPSTTPAAADVLFSGFVHSIAAANNIEVLKGVGGNIKIALNQKNISAEQAKDLHARFSIRKEELDPSTKS